MSEHLGGPFGLAPHPYTTSPEDGGQPRPSAFGNWDGYGGTMGFIDAWEPRTPEYQDAIDTVADSLSKRDFQDPRHLQVIKDMAAEHGIPAENAWWDLMDDPEGHEKGWLSERGNPGQFQYNWAYTNDAPFTDGYNEQQRNRDRKLGPKPHDPRDDLPIDPADLHLYVGAREAALMRAQAATARRVGNADLADEIEARLATYHEDPPPDDVAGYMLMPGYKGNEAEYEPPHHQEAPDTSRIQDTRAMSWNAPGDPGGRYHEVGDAGAPMMPFDHERERFERALREREMLTSGPDDMEWGTSLGLVDDLIGHEPIMASVSRETGLGRDFLALLRQAGPLQPGEEDPAVYEQAQFPSVPQKPTPKQRRDFKQPTKESLDPDMLDDRIDIDSLVKNALSRYRGATPEQLEEGKKWYATARARAEELARRTGGDFSKAAAIIAAMSPQLEWDANLQGAAHFLNTYNPAAKHDWRRPNISAEGLQAWNDLTGGRAPQTPEDFAELAKLAGVDDEDWAKEMAMEGRWDRASQQAAKKGYRHRGNYTGTGLSMLGDNVLRAMDVYDADDPSELLDYAKGGPKIHSFWRNFLGDEDYVTVDKHMLRALERGFGEDPLLSYGDKTGDGKRKKVLSPEDKRVIELEGILGRSKTLKGDEQQSVPIGYNTYAEAIRRATAQANAERDPGDQITPAQMQAIIWVQHKADMDAFRKRKSEEAWAQKNPGKPYQPPRNNYVPGVPTNGPLPDYYQSDEWAQENPYKGGVPRPLVPDFHGISMPPDNIPDPHLTPEDMGIMQAAPWADPAWSQGEPALPKAAGRIAMPMLYRGLETEFDPGFDTNTSSANSVSGYSHWTDSKDLARAYAGADGHVYEYDLPDEAMGQSYINDDGERPLYYDNGTDAGINGVHGREFLVYQDHEDYDPSKIRRSAGRWSARRDTILALQRQAPEELPYRTLLWMNQLMKERTRTPEEQDYAAALDAEVRLRGEQYARA